MNLKTTGLIALLCAATGMLLFMLHEEWVIIRFPCTAQLQQNTITQSTDKKRVTLYFWLHDAWHHESTELLWSNNQTKNLQYVISSWLALLDEDELMPKRVLLQQIMVTQSGNVYISFDRKPFSKETTTYKKWLWIEGLIKTIRENTNNLSSIYFLVDHKPLVDLHLDFSRLWPLQGFM